MTEATKYSFACDLGRFHKHRFHFLLIRFSFNSRVYLIFELGLGERCCRMKICEHEQRAENVRIVRLTKGTLVIISDRIHGKTDSARAKRYCCRRNINPTTSAIGNLIFLPTRKLNTAGPLLSYNQVVSSNEDGRAKGWNDSRVSVGVTGRGGGAVKKRAKWNLSAWRLSHLPRAIGSSSERKLRKAARRNLNSRK